MAAVKSKGQQDGPEPEGLCVVDVDVEGDLLHPDVVQLIVPVLVGHRRGRGLHRAGGAHRRSPAKDARVFRKTNWRFAVGKNWKIHLIILV